MNRLSKKWGITQVEEDKSLILRLKVALCKLKICSLPLLNGFISSM
jgi:hypothetical protein